MISLILQVLAFCLFALAATDWIPDQPRLKVVSTGLSFWILSELTRGLVAR